MQTSSAQTISATVANETIQSNPTTPITRARGTPSTPQIHHPSPHVRFNKTMPDWGEVRYGLGWAMGLWVGVCQGAGIHRFGGSWAPKGDTRDTTQEGGSPSASVLSDHKPRKYIFNEKRNCASNMFVGL